jgi:hypothetical protein
MFNPLKAAGAVVEVVSFLARDPYRKRLDNMTTAEALALAEQGKLTIRETERLLRIKHVATGRLPRS